MSKSLSGYAEVLASGSIIPFDAWSSITTNLPVPATGPSAASLSLPGEPLPDGDHILNSHFFCAASYT